MSRARTLTNLIADVRNRTNMENSTFVTDAEITEYLNQEIAELWARLTQGAGQPYYRGSTTYSVSNAGSGVYNLPSDFWVLQEVVATINGTSRNLAPFMPSERGTLSVNNPWCVDGSVMYRLAPSSIEFLPVTQSFTVTMYYTPAATRLASGSDTFDGFNGYEMAPIYGACATIQAKEQTDPSFYIGQRERIYKHIESLASQRDMGMPERVQDVVGYDANVLDWNL